MQKTISRYAILLSEIAESSRLNTEKLIQDIGLPKALH